MNACSYFFTIITSNSTILKRKTCRMLSCDKGDEQKRILHIEQEGRRGPGVQKQIHVTVSHWICYAWVQFQGKEQGGLDKTAAISVDLHFPLFLMRWRSVSMDIYCFHNS